MTVAIVTDSAAAIPAGLAERHRISVVPMWLTVDGVSIREGDRELGELLGDARVTTSAPSPGDFAAAIGAVLDDGAEGVVVVTIASSMSASHRAATVAARAHGDAVTVVDSRTASGGQALVALSAADCAARGASLVDVTARAEDVAARVRLVAGVPDLAHLVRGGRVPGIAGWAGRTLGITPLFEFHAGRVRRVRPAFSADAAEDRMVARFQRSAQPGARAHVVALHALAPDAADALLRRAVTDADVVESFASEFGSVMVAHAGPGVVGLAWWREPGGVVAAG